MPLRESPELVLKKFQQLVNVTPGGILSKEQLQQFVSSSFGDPGQEFEQWEPQDWASSPQILAKISDQKLQAWASDLNAKWKSLGRKIKDDVRTRPTFYSQIYVPHPLMVPGGRFIEYYYWDSYWVIEGLLLSEMAATAKGMIQNFLYLVERYGHIPNGGRVYYLRRSQPPFLTLMMDAYLAHANDTEFLRENIHLLEVEYEFWQRNRSVSITVGDRNHTLNYYNVQIGEPRPESYSKDWELASDLNEDARQELWAELKSAAESGWDFSSRWFLSWPPPLPATLKDTKARAVVPVDLNAFLCKTEHLLASFYRILGNTTKATQFQAALERRLEAVQAVFWNEVAGVWLDFNLLKKQPNPAFYPSNLAPLWTDCFSDQAAAERAVRYLEGSTVLSYRNGLPTSLARTGEQWDLPNAWPPLQHMVIAGLAKSSSSRAKEIAFALAQNWVRTNFALYKKYQAMFEKYNVDGDGKPGTGGEYQVQCFMNSILQCLSNTKELRDYCLQSQYVRDLNSNSRMHTALMAEFAKLIQLLWTSSPNEAVSPSEFKTQIQRYVPRFVGYNQQDAQEFLRFLLDGLHSEVNRVLVRPRSNLDNLDHLPDDEKGRQMWRKYQEREDSRIGDLFVGQLKSSLTCSECGYCSTAFDPFWDLSLPIAKKSYSEVTLLDCMRLFTKEDVLDGDEKPTCCRCKTRTRCTKKFSIQRFPKILVLHLKRFSEARIRTSKLTTFISFQLKDLDLREFAAQSCNHAVYNLYAVSNHSGTTMGGHYTAYCKSPVSGEWHTFNDSRVTPMSSSHVRSSDAYLLFYELASPSSRM